MTGRVIIGGASAPQLAPHVKMRFDKARDRWVVMAPERMLVPDEIAVEILQRCDGLLSVDAMADQFAKAYDAPLDEVKADIVAMLQDLADKGFIAA